MKEYEVGGFIEVSGQRRKLAKGEATLVMDDERFGHIVLHDRDSTTVHAPLDLQIVPSIEVQ